GRPGVHRLFVDLPFRCDATGFEGSVLETLARSSAEVHSPPPVGQQVPSDLAPWTRHPVRSSTWFIRGGPGQGKSTVSQFFCQVQRAAVLLNEPGLTVHASTRQL